MAQDSLSNLYLSNPKLAELIQTVTSEATKALKLLGETHNDSISEIVKLSADYINELGNLYISTSLQSAVTAYISALGSSITQSTASASNIVVKEVMKNLTPSPAFIPDEDYITLDKKVIKEYELPETIAIPIGHNRIKMKLDTLLAIIAIIISLFSSRPSASEQEQLALQRTEVQILSEILENTKASNATTSEQLDTLKESVDKIQKELAESKNNESGNQ